MTRINLVAPSLLCRQHLIAEYRELPRIFALVREARARGESCAQTVARAPRAYTLGTGHCRFFYPRLRWLSGRFLSLVREMQQRGYAPAHVAVPEWTADIPAEYWADWVPGPADVAVNVARINERLLGMDLPGMRLTLDRRGYRWAGLEEPVSRIALAGRRESV